MADFTSTSWEPFLIWSAALTWCFFLGLNFFFCGLVGALSLHGDWYSSLVNLLEIYLDLKWITYAISLTIYVDFRVWLKSCTGSMALIVDFVKHIKALMYFSDWSHSLLDSKHLPESWFIPSILNNFGSLSCREDDGSCHCLIRVYFREHELLLDCLLGKVVNVATHFLQSLTVVVSVAGDQAIICEEDALV